MIRRSYGCVRILKSMLGESFGSALLSETDPEDWLCMRIVSVPSIKQSNVGAGITP